MNIDQGNNVIEGDLTEDYKDIGDHEEEGFSAKICKPGLQKYLQDCLLHFEPIP